MENPLWNTGEWKFHFGLQILTDGEYWLIRNTVLDLNQWLYSKIIIHSEAHFFLTMYDWNELVYSLCIYSLYNCNIYICDMHYMQMEPQSAPWVDN